MTSTEINTSGPTSNNTNPSDSQVFPYFAPRTTESRLRHFTTGVYRTDPTTYLYKYVDALCGDGGAGSLKKELTLARMQASLDATFFGDLDNIFGNIGILTRYASESYTYDPANQMLTSDQWDEIKVKDAWYRQRIKDFMLAIGKGGTSEGIRLMTRAALGVDAELYEVWRYKDEFDAGRRRDFRTNLALDPSFEYDVVPALPPVGAWTSTQTSGTAPTKATLTTAAKRGTKAFRATQVTATSTGFVHFQTATGIVPGISYAWSIWARQVVGTFTSFRVRIDWTLGGSPVSTSNGSQITLTTGSPGPWVQASVIAVAPPGTDGCKFVVEPQVTGSMATNASFDIDSALIEPGATVVGADFDGDTAGAKWNGTDKTLSTSRTLIPVETYGRTGVSLRNEVVIKPLKALLTIREKYLLNKLVDRIRPQDTVITIDVNGLAVHVPILISAMAASSSYFQIEKTVTGVPDLSKIPPPEVLASDLDPANQWLQPNVAKTAPTSAFNNSQESSFYYLCSNTGETQIDSVSYSAEDPNGVITGNVKYAQFSEASSWTAWAPWELGDSPDNFPGGKFGRTPLVAPAITQSGIPYIFPFSSQVDFVNKQKQVVLQNGGQASDTQYRLPLSRNVAADKKLWEPILAIPLTLPIRESSVTTSWMRRPEASSASHLQTANSSLYAGS